jgi:TatD DNase family protein
MNTLLTDISINLTNKQFQNDIETIIQNAIDAEAAKMILTGTGIRSS